MAVTVIGAPVGVGAGRRGAEAGPHALRQAGLREALAASGRAVADRGDVRPAAIRPLARPNPALKALPEIAAWTAAIHDAVAALPAGDMPLILGGDHSCSLGSVPALAERARAAGRPFFLLWIDAHPDCHSLATSVSGNLHGTPVAYAMGAPGFKPQLPTVSAPLPGANIRMVGIRDIDAAEAAFLACNGVTAHDPADLRRSGAAALASWLSDIRRVGGTLHVSLDADALDPALAPGVGTPVPDGLTIEDVRAVLGQVRDAGVLGSLEFVEVNPFLDRGGRTAQVMVELAAEALRVPGQAQGRAEA